MLPVLATLNGPICVPSFASFRAHDYPEEEIRFFIADGGQGRWLFSDVFHLYINYDHHTAPGCSGNFDSRLSANSPASSTEPELPASLVSIFRGFRAWWMWRTICLGKLARLEKKLRVAFGLVAALRMSGIAISIPVDHAEIPSTKGR
jgi:hypothetical protein